MLKFGLLGETLGHSQSPELHKKIMEQRNLAGSYTLIEIPRERFHETFLSLKASGEYRGLNVTIPYKQTVLPLLDQIAPQAQTIGAVNTILFPGGGKAVGYNTDYFGVIALLRENQVDVRGKTALLLGAGGVARAVIAALCDEGASHIAIASRSAGNTRPTADSANAYMDCPLISYQELEEGFRADVIINCTPVGMWPQVDVSPLPLTTMERVGAFAALDMIYNPQETLFLKYARQLSMTAACGMTMLWEQAVKAQDIWAGLDSQIIR